MSIVQLQYFCFVVLRNDFRTSAVKNYYLNFLISRSVIRIYNRDIGIQNSFWKMRLWKVANFLAEQAGTFYLPVEIPFRWQLVEQ